MFDENLIPPHNVNLKNHLAGILSRAGVNPEYKAVIDRKLDKIDKIMRGKIMSTITISEYLDKMWEQPELKEDDKLYIVGQLEIIQANLKTFIVSGQQPVANTPGNLDVLNEKYQITPYEEFNIQEKVKVMKEKGKLEIDNSLIAHQKGDLEILHALNKPSRSAQNFTKSLHYTVGLKDPDLEDTELINRAERFVKKIKADRKSFDNKIKRLEKSAENRDQVEYERLLQKDREDEEERFNKKKQKMADHIKELNNRSEVRLQNLTKWQEDQKVYMSKKPLFKEMENNFVKAHVLPELEKRKRKLQEIRALHRPIERDDIEEHKEKVTKLYEEKMFKRKVMAEALRKDIEKPSYQSAHHQAFVEEVAQLRRAKDDEFAEKVQRREKVKELWQEIKDNHMPEVDPAKELELKTLIEKINKKEKKFQEDEEEDDPNKPNPRKVGLEYLKVLKDMVKTKMDKSKLSIAKSDGEEESNKKSKSASNLANATGHRKNYLHELRKEHKIPQNVSEVQSIIKKKDLDDKAKQELLKGQVEKLEEKARQQEALGKYKSKKGDAVDVDEYAQVNQLYINTIKAKLEMLGAN